MRHVMITGNLIPEEEKLMVLAEKLSGYKEELLVLFDVAQYRSAGIFEKVLEVSEDRCILPMAFRDKGPLDFGALEENMAGFPASETLLFCVSPHRFREIVRHYSSGFNFDEVFLRRMLLEKNRVLHIDLALHSLGII